MMLAWFSASLKIAAPSAPTLPACIAPASAGITVALAWKPLENSSAASHCLNAASFCSTASVMSRVPVTRREAGAPAP